MGLSDIEIEKQNKALRKEITEKCRKAAEERGEEFKTFIRACPFLNDDVPKYLAKMKKDEKESRKPNDIIVRKGLEYTPKSFEVSEEYKRRMEDLFRWFESSQKSNYFFREAI